MARAIWSGTIAFGLVSVPVRMESAVEEHKLHFNLVHEPDGGRIGYQKVCKKEGKPVDDDEIVKAFEIRKGKWVYLEDEVETRTGLIIPQSAEAGCRPGIVTAVGSEAIGIDPGDKVLFPKDAGYDVRLGGVECKVLRRSQLIARVHD